MGQTVGDIGLIVQDLNDAVMAANARLDARFLQAVSGKDVEGVMQCLLDSPELALVLYGKVLRGPEEARRFLTETFSGARAIRLTIDEVKRWRLGDTVFAVGLATYELEGPDGTKSTVKECWTDARRNVAGRWVYVLDHATVMP